MTLPNRLTVTWLVQAREAGFDCVELFADRQSLDYRDREQLGDLGRWFHDSELRPHALHTPPELNIAEMDRARRLFHCDELKRALETLEQVPCQYVVQHLGARDDPFHGKRIDAAFESLEVLNMFARDRGATILLENGTSEFSAPACIVRFLELTRLGNGVSFDAGHAHIRGGVEDGFRSLEPYVRAVHVHDNDGMLDQHLLPGAGSIDWRAVMEWLRKSEVLVASIRDNGEWALPQTAVRDALSRMCLPDTGRRT